MPWHGRHDRQRSRGSVAISPEHVRELRALLGEVRNQQYALRGRDDESDAARIRSFEARFGSCAGAKRDRAGGQLVLRAKARPATAAVVAFVEDQRERTSARADLPRAARARSK